MKIGVTGATGQLGVKVIKELKEKISTDQIVALVRSPKKAADLGVEVRSFDYNEPDIMVESLKDIDKLLLISSNEIGKRLEQHTNVIEAAQKAGVKFIAYTSLLHAETSSLVLAGEHVETEKVLKSIEIPFTILRHGWYTENYTNSIYGAIAGGVLLGSSGDGKISSATRDDFAKAAAEVLTSEGHEGKTYELAGDEAFTMSDMAAEIAQQTGKNIVYKNLPVAEYATALENAGLPEGIAQFLAGTHVSTEKGDLFDSSHQLSQLIKKPTTSLAQAIADALAGL
ncbi:MAG: SDR family oxidoreductase [Bacteroidetes bacterium]|nr:SDR family oxidoreductase [Bacteroidota bacterium]MBU1115929.1 SDR family oxidoreductase [Bacteroidota bacterium]MBU1798474.1 SDR family oxidoreductase [Bacteroidota bacterium]